MQGSTALPSSDASMKPTDIQRPMPVEDLQGCGVECGASPSAPVVASHVRRSPRLIKLAGVLNTAGLRICQSSARLTTLPSSDEGLKPTEI